MNRARIRSPWRLVCSAAAIFCLSACGASDPPIEDDGLTIHNPHDGFWQDRDEVPIRFELEQTFGAEEEPEEALLGGIQYTMVDGERNVYLFDWSSSRLVSFAPDGSFRWATGREGQGPGEFQNVRGVVWGGGDRLYVSNQTGKQLDEYGTDGVRRGSIPVELDSVQFPGLVGFIHPDLFVFETHVKSGIGTRLILARRGETWHEVASIEEDQSSSGLETPGVSTGPDVHVAGDRIYVGHVEQYRIAVYDTSGTLVRVIRRDMHDLIRPGRYQNEGMSAIATFSRLGPFLRLHSGHALAYAGWATNIDDPDEAIKAMVNDNGSIRPEWVNVLDVYDPRDRLLYTVSGQDYAPEIGRPEFVDPDGKLYTIQQEPYPHIRRYRVEVDE